MENTYRPSDYNSGPYLMVESLTQRQLPQALEVLRFMWRKKDLPKLVRRMDKIVQEFVPLPRDPVFTERIRLTRPLTLELDVERNGRYSLMLPSNVLSLAEGDTDVLAVYISPDTQLEYAARLSLNAVGVDSTQLPFAETYPLVATMYGLLQQTQQPSDRLFRDPSPMSNFKG